MGHENAALADLTPEARRALLAELLRKQARATVTTHPTTYGQRALWYIHQMAPDTTAYNIGAAFHVGHPVDVAALRRALQTIVDRHASLRTTFMSGEHGPVQQVHGAMTVDFTQVDASGWDDQRMAQEEARLLHTHFDMVQGPLLRVYLLTRTPASHHLLIAFHHTIADGWSIGLFIYEVSVFYAAAAQGVAAHLAAPKYQYADFAEWQAALLAGSEGARMRDFWLQRFSGDLPQLELPTDHPRPALQTFNGASVGFNFNADVLARLHALAAAEQTTLNTVLLATFETLLHRYTGQNDIIVGSPLACRAQSDFQRTMGFFANAMPLRSRFDDAPSFHTLLARTRASVFDAVAHQEYPFALLVEQLKPPRNANRAPVFEVAFNFMREHAITGLGETHAAGNNHHQLVLEPLSLAQEAGQFDLALDIAEYDNLLRGVISYNRDLFEEATIARMAKHYQQLVQALLAHPDMSVDALPMLAPAELAARAEWNATASSYPADLCLHDLVAAQAARTPDAVALRYGEQSLSYAALEQRANTLAHHLRSLGVARGALVGVYMERSLDMLVALLAVLKAGGAYVPLDPGFPASRIAMMLEDSALRLVLTQNALVDALPSTPAQRLCIDGDWAQNAADAHSPLPDPAQPEDLAYVIFTSGSTGRPKGVQIPHRAVVNFLVSMSRTPGMDARDVLAAVTTLSFDIAVLELFLPLVTGAQCTILSRETAANGALLVDALAASGATVMQATPVTWRMLLAAGWRAPAGFRALCGGEALPPSLAQDLLDAGAELWNMYGPTETTIWSAVEQITDATSPILIGRPIANTQLYILNGAMQRNPVGVVGELWIGGDGLAHGYLNRPDLTAERFVDDPYRTPGSRAPLRIYRTGDLARRHADGRVEVLGRTDHQVKIRGYRIELGEIEVALAHHPAIREAVVVARDDGRGAQRLVAYLIAEGDAPPAGELRLFLRPSLPDYMIPAAFMVLDAFPHTPNGKVDRRALPSPETLRLRRDEAKAPPTTPTEQTVAAVWSELLGGAQVGVYDNFFDLGGHSLLAMEALSKLEHILGPALNPALFRAQTLGQVAASYDEMLAPAAAEAPTPSAPGNDAKHADARDDATPAPTAPDPKPQPASQPDAAPHHGIAGRFFGAVKRAVNPDAKP